MLSSLNTPSACLIPRTDDGEMAIVFVVCPAMLKYRAAGRHN